MAYMYVGDKNKKVRRLCPNCVIPMDVKEHNNILTFYCDRCEKVIKQLKL